jgi:hypothetical protein
VKKTGLPCRGAKFQEGGKLVSSRKRNDVLSFNSADTSKISVASKVKSDTNLGLAPSMFRAREVSIFQTSDNSQGLSCHGQSGTLHTFLFYITSIV